MIKIKSQEDCAKEYQRLLDETGYKKSGDPEFDRMMEFHHLTGLVGNSTERALNRIITRCPQVIEIKKRLKILATVNDPVLLTGDSGTGKELAAKVLHGERTGIFCAINCSAVVENLIESELFGHVKGAFTSAHVDKDGLIAQASGGSLFLDEINSASKSFQAKLLRVIEEGEYRRVGSASVESTDCRFIFASNSTTLSELRRDFYYRISTFQIDLPNLVSRGDDYKLIAEECGYQDWMGAIPDEVFEGNIRSLKAWIRRQIVYGKLI